MKKSSVGWLFAVIVLSCFLIVSIVLGLTGYYFSVSYLNSNSDFVLGESVTIGIQHNQANVVSFTYDGAYLPGEMLSQKIQISSLDMNKNVKIRVKAQVYNEDGVTMFDFVTTEHFEKGLDGYYYYDDVLEGGNKITFCNYVTVPKENKFVSREKYILSLIVENLEADLDVENIWKMSDNV